MRALWLPRGAIDIIDRDAPKTGRREHVCVLVSPLPRRRRGFRTRQPIQL